MAEASFRGWASEDELRRQVEKNAGRTGLPRLRRILDIEGGPQRTRSKNERALLRLLREGGITGFQTNERIHGYEVGFLWRDLDFCVEVDGWDAHKDRVKFERDRRKWAELKARGVTVMPLGDRLIRDEPSKAIELLLAALRIETQKSGGVVIA